jgi:hypothetical protein
MLGEGKIKELSEMLMNETNQSIDWEYFNTKERPDNSADIHVGTPSDGNYASIAISPQKNSKILGARCTLLAEAR